jgi:hypothetical protein
MGLPFSIPRGNEIRKTEEYLVESTPKSKQLQQQRSERYQKDGGMEAIDCIKGTSFDSTGHVGVLPSATSVNNDEIRTSSIGTEEEILAKPQPALKYW